MTDVANIADQKMKLLITYPAWVFQPIKDIVLVVGASFLDSNVDCEVRGVDSCVDINYLARHGGYTHILVVNAHDFLEREKTFYLDRHKNVTLMSYNLEQTPIEGSNSFWASMRLSEVGVYGPYFDYIVNESECKNHDIEKMGFRVLNLNLPYHHCADRCIDTPKIEDKKYDIFFAGAGNERRQKIVDALLKEGLTFAPSTTIDALDMTNKSRLIQQSRVCLNLHFSEMEYFEKPRIMYDILANKGMCLTEKIAHPEAFANTKDMYMCSYANIVPLAVMLAKKYDEKIHHVGPQGYKTLIENYHYEKVIPHFLKQLELGSAL